MSIRKAAISGAIWTYGLQFGNQFINFFVSLILARHISPEEFGLIGMISIFIALGTALFEGGMTSSLIRSTELEDSDYSTVFLFNLGISAVIYLTIYSSAGFIADFYNQKELIKILRVYSLIFVISSFGTVQNTILTRNMQFKKQTLINLPSIAISSFAGVIMALNGFGVWAIVYSAILNSILTTAFLWLNSSWYPSLKFSKNKFKTHFNYGVKLTLSSVLDIFFTNIYQILIGKFYAARLVGFYNRANSLMMLPVGNISTAINKVAFPLFAKVQHDPLQLKRVYMQIMQMVFFVVTPIMLLASILAESLVLLLFGEVWLPMVPMFQILCFTGILFPIHLYNLLILQVKGRSDLFLTLEIIKKIVQGLIIYISFGFGIYGLLWGQLIFSVIALGINTFFAGSMLNYKLSSQLKDLSPVLISATIMALLTYFLKNSVLNDVGFLQLSIISIIGIAFYLLISFIFKIDALLTIKKIILKEK